MVAQASRIALRRAAAAQPLVRTLHSSRVVRAGASSSSSAAEQEYPAEGFGAPIWKYSIAAVIVGFGAYRFSAVYGEPRPVAAGEDPEQPWLTRYIANWLVPANTWRDRSNKHLGQILEHADRRLVFQDAERPPVHRYVFPQ